MSSQDIKKASRSSLKLPRTKQLARTITGLFHRWKSRSPYGLALSKWASHPSSRNLGTGNIAQLYYHRTSVIRFKNRSQVLREELILSASIALPLGDARMWTKGFRSRLFEAGAKGLSQGCRDTGHQEGLLLVY